MTRKSRDRKLDQLWPYLQVRGLLWHRGTAAHYAGCRVEDVQRRIARSVGTVDEWMQQRRSAAFTPEEYHPRLYTGMLEPSTVPDRQRLLEIAHSRIISCRLAEWQEWEKAEA